MTALLRNRIGCSWNERTGKGNGEVVGRVLGKMLMYGRVLNLYRYLRYVVGRQTQQF